MTTRVKIPPVSKKKRNIKPKTEIDKDEIIPLDPESQQKVKAKSVTIKEAKLEVIDPN